MLTLRTGTSCAAILGPSAGFRFIAASSLITSRRTICATGGQCSPPLRSARAFTVLNPVIPGGALQRRLLRCQAIKSIARYRCQRGEVMGSVAGFTR